MVDRLDFGKIPGLEMHLSLPILGYYFVVNQQMGTIVDLWDGEQLRCDFRRTFTPHMMDMWFEIVEIAKTINFSEEEDQLIWKYESSDVYSSKSLYDVKN
jgi:hypothetical protein